ncbi:MAG: radical SAM protein, partial [Burkholderiales bacterium]
MRFLLINPALPESFWSFRWALELVPGGKRALNPPLGLATLAALCPPHWQVTIVDENVEPLPLRPEADLIGIGGMGVQAPRQKQLLRYYREAGYRVVAGGSYASLCPEEYAPLADTVIAGEAEYIWPRYCADLERGAPQALHGETGNVRLEDSPLPRFDLLQLHAYSTASLQLSRGCPFSCEFCDIIVMFGRKPRYKAPAQIERELDSLRRLGARKVFFVDDNFIGNKAKASATLDALAAYQDRHGRRMRFGTEASLNLSKDPALLAQFRAAGFEWAFLGLETPDPQTLREAGKPQNTAGDMLAAVRRIHAAGLDILGGFIVGFDRDTPAVFGQQRRFILDSGIMVAMVGLLTALPKTPLYERLKREGRLDESAANGDNTRARTNIVPKSMRLDELTSGYQRLYAELLTDGGIAERIRNKLAHFGTPAQLVRESPSEGARILWRLLTRGIARGGPARAWHFLRSLPLARPRLLPLAVNDWIAGLSMRDYAERHFGLPAPRAAMTPERALARLRASLQSWRRRGAVRLALHRPLRAEPQIAVRITGALDRALARKLARQLGTVLRRSRTR